MSNNIQFVIGQRVITQPGIWNRERTIGIVTEITATPLRRYYLVTINSTGKTLWYRDDQLDPYILCEDTMRIGRLD